MILFSACGGSEEEYTDRMAAEHEGDEPTSNVSPDYMQGAYFTSGEVTYMMRDERSAIGFYAEPEGTGDDSPALIVIHEWWGLNDNIRMMTEQLAAKGYKALAIDLYGGKVADNPEASRQLMQGAMDNPDAAIQNLQAAITYLQDEMGAERLGVIGWCFGGAWSLNLSLASPDDIDATVIYYGQLNANPDELAALNSPVLGIFGEEDDGIPVESVREFEEALNQADVENEIHIYEGADHAFANPSGNRYNEEAAIDAWEKTMDFLNRTL